MSARLLSLFFILFVSFGTAFAQPTGEGALSDTAIREFSIASSMRVYYENRNTRSEKPMAYIDVPTGAAIFPAEIFATLRSWAENSYNIVSWTVMPRGGHFAAPEESDLLIDDVRSFFRGLR